MNTRFQGCPEIIGTVTQITKSGDERFHGDLVVGVECERRGGVPVVAIDVRGFTGGNLTVELELSELVKAVALAAANARKEGA